MIARLISVALIAGTLLAQQPQKTTINFPTRSGASWPLFIAKRGRLLPKVRARRQSRICKPSRWSRHGDQRRGANDELFAANLRCRQARGIRRW